MPIKFNDVSHIYSPHTPFECGAISNVTFEIEKGDFIALVGRTGSGKSTLVQHLNALLLPTSGKLEVDEFILSPNKKERTKKLNPLRKKVGMVFQFPENQLFEETVEKDVMFGPKNFGASDEEAKKIACEALEKVGLDESFYKRSPFELSGGEKRRVAIAGVLALQSEVLVLDEPTAGLDPAGSKEIMKLFKKIHESGVTIILVTHDMNLVYKYTNRVILMDDGEIKHDVSPKRLFTGNINLYSLEVPPIFDVANKLKEKGLNLNVENINDLTSLVKEIKRVKDNG